ncbi:MAG: hypothetical protein WCA10_02515 [Terracidiphilus sp.]
MKRNARLTQRLVAASLGLLGLTLISGCHSYHIEATVENHTGGAITLLEVDYPSASFGADTLAADAVYHHRIQIRDSGPISVQYTAAGGHQVLVKGPTLYEKQEGSIQIVLLPDGKAEFYPALQPRN